MTAPTCVCAHNTDGSVTTFLCPAHADTDPCLTMSWVTGKRRKGTIRRGVCTSCGHGAVSVTAAIVAGGGMVPLGAASALQHDTGQLLGGSLD